MSTILGSLDIKDSERPFESVKNQRIIWESTQEMFARYNQDMEDARQLFVQETTIMHKERYELPGGGEAESIAFQETDMGETKRSGSWDVSYPIWVMGAGLSSNRVALAYLTMGAYRANLETIQNQVNNTTFRRILSAIFKNTNTTFTDPVYGSLTCVPLANTDGTLYPPKLGSTSDADETYYLGSSYTDATISNTNNPFVTIRDAIEPRYGYAQGGSPIVVLVANSAVQYIRPLADFDPTPYHNTVVGDDITVPAGFPTNRLIPASARVEGVCNGCWIVSWPRMPANYMIGIHTEAIPPLKYRIDDVPGLGDGQLQMIAEDPEYPFKKARWLMRGGYGVGNRIGAVVLHNSGAGTYTIPTGYSSLQ